MGMYRISMECNQYQGNFRRFLSGYIQIECLEEGGEERARVSVISFLGLMGFHIWFVKGLHKRKDQSRGCLMRSILGIGEKLRSMHRRICIEHYIIVFRVPIETCMHHLLYLPMDQFMLWELHWCSFARIPSSQNLLWAGSWHQQRGITLSLKGSPWL